MERTSGDVANRRLARQLMAMDLLTPERELALATRWREARDEAALHALVLAYGRLVLGHAARFRRYGLPVEDLVQEGQVALLQAAERFDPSRGVRFVTYAQWWIRAAMQEFILRNWSIVRTGSTTTQKSLFFKLRSLRAQILRDGSDGDTSEQMARLAAALGVDAADVEAMNIVLAGRDRSLNEPGGAGERERQETLADVRPTPEDIVTHIEIQNRVTRTIEDALAALNERERHIIVARCLDESGTTLDALGRTLGISKERVRQLEKRALDKIRTRLDAESGDPRDLLTTA
ncbi:MAG: RNA polymerase factor sigma-32 [Rhodospirillaceae bacterium]